MRSPAGSIARSSMAKPEAISGWSLRDSDGTCPGLASKEAQFLGVDGVAKCCYKFVLFTQILSSTIGADA